MPRSKEGLARLVARSGVSPRVAEAFERVDRAHYVPRDLLGSAYGDRPVSIPQAQTTSQPTLIAHMVDSVDVGSDDRVLEIGTGYGFQTALLADLGAEVISIERHAELAEEAARNLDRQGVTNATVHTGDGWKGWPEGAPYDAIVVSAAATDVPGALVDQLAEAGRMVIPLKTPLSDEVTLFEKREGALQRLHVVTPARFVPLVPGEAER